jgi:hypothetical protein
VRRYYWLDRLAVLCSVLVNCFVSIYLTFFVFFADYIFTLLCTMGVVVVCNTLPFLPFTFYRGCVFFSFVASSSVVIPTVLPFFFVLVYCFVSFLFCVCLTVWMFILIL